jgi:hypothetical protein
MVFKVADFPTLTFWKEGSRSYHRTPVTDEALDFVTAWLTTM